MKTKRAAQKANRPQLRAQPRLQGAGGARCAAFSGLAGRNSGRTSVWHFIFIIQKHLAVSSCGPQLIN